MEYSIVASMSRYAMRGDGRASRQCFDELNTAARQSDSAWEQKKPEATLARNA